jgi:hypothetical protein
MDPELNSNLKIFQHNNISLKTLRIKKGTGSETKAGSFGATTLVVRMYSVADIIIGGIFKPQTRRVCEIAVWLTQIADEKSEVNCLRSVEKNSFVPF